MDKNDLKFMQEAAEWAEGCHPIKEEIPRVEAIIVAEGRAIGRDAAELAKRVTMTTPS
jgi:pyrimidine deaminase RibD-like protein